MASLIDVVGYVLASYPKAKRDDLSNARVTKIIYLADWKHAIEHGRQITDIKWFFDNYGPFVHDVGNTALAHPDIVRVETTSNVFGNSKRLFKLIVPEYSPNSLSPTEKQAIDHAIKQTADRPWNSFVQLIYSTYPVVSSERYSWLDLVSQAKAYKEQAP